jgi:adenine-specific DNA methylase
MSTSLMTSNLQVFIRDLRFESNYISYSDVAITFLSQKGFLNLLAKFGHSKLLEPEPK